MPAPNPRIFHDAMNSIFMPKILETFAEVKTSPTNEGSVEDLVLSMCGYAMLSGFQKMLEQADEVPAALAPALELFWDMLNPETAHQHDIMLHIAARLQPAPSFVHRPVYSTNRLSCSPEPAVHDSNSALDTGVRNPQSGPEENVHESHPADVVSSVPSSTVGQGLPIPSVLDICEGELQQAAFITHESEVLHQQLQYIEERIHEAQQRHEAFRKSEVLNMAYMPKMPRMPAIHAEDLPNEMPTLVLDLMKTFLETTEVCNTYIKAEINWWEEAQNLSSDEADAWWKRRALHFVHPSSRLFPQSMFL
ncbi:hypothetical protein FOMPIDRAFT_1056548 [Fomitopsis schrenkii]|uniref:Uncharacterized protein n=1 Tax=Fomitopsis schrenkii TaxID=2126942 RepID=S8DGZ9_FOMSC|nr:hypothetical protein FOMPIDRAFT_1056548 [Fomitopsis schrenkii]